MISDVLSDAKSQIETYLTDFPHYYAKSKPEIEQLLEAMERLRIKLDSPPNFQK